MDEIREIFERLAGPLPSWATLTPHIRLFEVAKGAPVFAVEQPAPCVFVVLNGLLKLHHDDADGRERIKSFAEEGGIIASIAALQPDGRASFSATALEASSLARIPYRMLENLADSHTQWGRFLRLVLMNYALQKELREQGFLMQSAEARYEALVKAQPALAARIAKKDMAAYIGVTPVGLSRISGRVCRKFKPD
jgi:CRP-like cAMP-binding protein